MYLKKTQIRYNRREGVALVIDKQVYSVFFFFFKKKDIYIFVVGFDNRDMGWLASIQVLYVPMKTTTGNMINQSKFMLS